MSLISIATFIVTLGFALVCIYIAKLLLRVTGLMKGLSKTFDEVEQKLDSTVTETELLIAGMEQTATVVERKLTATNGVFNSVQDVGKATLNLSTVLKSKTQNYSENKPPPGAKPFIRSIQWGEYTDVLFNSWKRGKKAALATERKMK